MDSRRRHRPEAVDIASQRKTREYLINFTIIYVLLLYLIEIYAGDNQIQIYQLETRTSLVVLPQLPVNMDPSGPPQPPKETAYETQGNPATSNPSEQDSARHHAHGKPVDERSPSSRSSGLGDAVPSSLGYGIHGAPAGEERYGRTQEQVGRSGELEGDQMRAPGEGDVASAVERKSGASGSQPDLASDLDRKKREQASKREAIKEDGRQGRAPDEGDVRAGIAT
ncbi:hypothetical protein F5Y13DRAFT_153035 [Hypoxylon sp. FL1857]|nr:hypothetical protein F5Y13DRAFT_153035 [Hypoxylon sp. FL1857]